jgi:DivIVA domain-containing protein
MSSRGQSPSMFVVQRTFRRVRRGYDPDEVDRDLELVSQWFTSADAGLALAEERARLQQREAEGRRLLEGARLEGEATLEGARLRARADARAGSADARRGRGDPLSRAGRGSGCGGGPGG